MKKGFTLIELIITIVLLGIVSGLGINLISTVFTGYTDTKLKNFLYNEAKFTVERIDRELRVAIPNTIHNPNSDTTIIQFGELKNAGYYDNVSEDNITCRGISSITNGELISIYNTSPDDFYTKSRVYSINDNGSFPVTKLDKTIQKNSPYKRFFIIATPVTFYFDNSKKQIIRCFNYPIDDSNYGKDSGKCNVLTNYVKNVIFEFEQGITWRTAIVRISLFLEKNGINLEYKHEVHIRNTP